LSGVNVAETVLVFVGIPLAFVVVLALLIFLPGERKRPRYKSGQPWNHAPVWYEPHPDHAPDARHSSHHALEAGSTISAGPLGGARGTW
jgi:hypothetical protein